MFTLVELQAIIFRMLITHISGNLERFIQNVSLNGTRLNIFNHTYLDLYIELDGKTPYLYIKHGALDRVKLGTGKYMFNKRVINDLEALFHSRFRSAYESGIDEVGYDISRLSLRYAFNSFRLMERITGKNKVIRIKSMEGANYFETIMDGYSALTLNFFNKGRVNIQLQNPIADKYWIIKNVGPVKNMEYIEFSGVVNKDPMDKWYKEALHKYVKDNFK